MSRVRFVLFVNFYVIPYGAIDTALQSKCTFPARIAPL